MSLAGIRVHFHNLGCRLNQAETDSLETRFVRSGCQVLPSAAGADLVVVNTCTITNKADRKTRNTISHLRWEAGPDCLLVLTGCFVENHPDYGAGSPDPNTLLVDNSHKSRLFDIVAARLAGQGWTGPAGSAFDYAESGETRRTRAFLKIQDGCDQFCTYCIVPHVRGRAQSRPAGDILQNARQLISQGYRELVLTGVNISRWSAAQARESHPAGPATAAPEQPEQPEDFASLVRCLLDLPGDWRLRIASLEPDLCDAAFAELFRSPRLMPHLHLCLQSGSDRVLQAMGRSTGVAAFLDFCAALRRISPRFALSTDLICGFPGESAAEFQQSLDTCRQAGFSRIHVFPYSRRTGTRADRLPGHLPPAIIQERCQAAQELSRELETRWLSGLQSTRQVLLCEKAWLDQDQVILEGHVPSFDLLRARKQASQADLQGFDPARYRKNFFSCRVDGSDSGPDGLFLTGTVIETTKTGFDA